MIVFKLVSKKFGERLVLDRVSLTIEHGEFVCLTGESGAGKSTFLNLLVGALLPTSGQVLVDRHNLKNFSESKLAIYRRKLGVVFQDFKLLPRKTVAENVAFALEVCGESLGLIESRVEEVLQIVGLAQRAHAFPAELSGGERSRVGVARALVNEPDLILADEPTGNLDPVTAGTIIRLLQEINQAGATVILATHDWENVKRLKCRVIRLKDGKLRSDLTAD